MARTPANPTHLTWRKSSYSEGGAGNCVEVAAPIELTDLSWRKSSYSEGGASNCLETADGLGDTVPVRDSKRPEGDILLFSRDAWSRFLAHQAPHHN